MDACCGMFWRSGRDSWCNNLSQNMQDAGFCTDEEGNTMKKSVVIIIVALFAITGFMLVSHLNKQDDREGLVINSLSGECVVPIDSLETSYLEGDVRDGKGTVTHHVFAAIELKSVLDINDIDYRDRCVVAVTSADNYSAVFSCDEILRDGKVYIITEKDGERITDISGEKQGLELVVFGDENSQRCVRYVARVDITEE